MARVSLIPPLKNPKNHPSKKPIDSVIFVAAPNPYTAQGYSGPDPIHNFMDYSSDACYTSFTPGQGARMLNIWQIYREGR